MRNWVHLWKIPKSRVMFIYINDLLYGNSPSQVYLYKWRHLWKIPEWLWVWSIYRNELHWYTPYRTYDTWCVIAQIWSYRTCRLIAPMIPVIALVRTIITPMVRSHPMCDKELIFITQCWIACQGSGSIIGLSSFPTLSFFTPSPPPGRRRGLVVLQILRFVSYKWNNFIYWYIKIMDTDSICKLLTEAVVFNFKSNNSIIKTMHRITTDLNHNT